MRHRAPIAGASAAGEAIAEPELASLFSGLAEFRRVILAVSGGPDSIALLVLLHRWRAARHTGPELVAATVDHGLRPESTREAAMVGRLAKQLGVRHCVLTWAGRKPTTGLQRAAREARYGLLLELARKFRAEAVVTAHTQDDQAETLLMRMARGSGLAGLAGIRARSVRDGIAIVRPLLDVPKARLVATLSNAGIGFAQDPTNQDPRFTRVRVRKIVSTLAEEGLDAARLGALARRLQRADAAIEAVADELQPALSGGPWPEAGPVRLEEAAFFRLPDEISMRLLGRAIEHTGDEGPVELAKLEALHAALKDAHAKKKTMRRTLAGAMVGFERNWVVVVRAPARRKQNVQARRSRT